MKVGGNAARVFSTAVESSDMLNLGMQVTALLMNSIVLGQVMTYPGAEETTTKVSQQATTSAQAKPTRSSSPNKKPKKVKRD